MCPDGWISAESVSPSCSECPLGRQRPSTMTPSEATTCTTCVEGKFASATATVTCTTCDAGQYQDMRERSLCIECPEGRYNLNTTYGGGSAAHDHLDKCLHCAAGTYFDSTVTQCRVCPSGWVQKESGVLSAKCRECVAGRYNVKTGEEIGFFDNRNGDHRLVHDTDADCNFCKAGTYFVDKISYCKVCQSGFIQVSDSAVDAKCTECAFGRYNKKSSSLHVTDAGATINRPTASDRLEMWIDHRIGELDLRGNHDEATDCNYCVKGTYFVSKVEYCNVCPNGYIQNKDVASQEANAQCERCPEGRYNLQRSQVVPWVDLSVKPAYHDNFADCVACPAGFSSGVGNIPAERPLFVCVGCQAGMFANDEGATVCQLCSAGKYAEFKNVVCRVCEEGSYQDEVGAAWCKTCPNGRWSVSDNTDANNHLSKNNCEECSVGQYNSDDTLIKKMGWSSVGTTVHDEWTSSHSTSGFAFNVEEDAPQRSLLSVRGTFTMEVTEDYQVMVPYDCNCNEYGRCSTCTKPTYPSRRRIGSVIYPINLEATRTVCRILNRVETRNTDDFSFQQATSRSGQGSARNLECSSSSPLRNLESCSHVRWNDRIGVGQPSGNYALIECGACLPGLTEGLMNSDGVLVPHTPAGYCANYRQNRQQCIKCPAGWHQTNVGMSSCTQCEIGRYNPSHTDGPKECKLCEKGQYQDQLRTTTCIDCPRGRYGTNIEYVKYQDCTECVVGKFLDVTGMKKETDCKLCDQGRSASPKGSSYGDDCPSCEAGRYMDQKGLQDLTCKQCPAGSFGNQTGLKSAQATTASSNDGCTSCGKGFFVDHNTFALSAQDCNECAPGFYTDTARQPFCKKCAIGRYHDGLTEKNPITGMVEKMEKWWCKNCPAGYYQDEVAQPQCLKKCPAGRYGDNFNYSNEELGFVSYQNCTLCPAGRWSDDMNGLTHSALDCTPCAEGQYGTEEGCSSYISSDVDERLLVGGGVLRTCRLSCGLCPKGKWSNAAAANNIAACLNCVEGKYLDREGKTSADSCIDCPQGRFGVLKGLVSGIFRTDLNSEEMCTGCVAGRYNNVIGSKTIAACLFCPKGYYLETTNDQQPNSNVDQSDCKPCISGRYSDGVGFTYKTQEKDENGENIHEKYCRACRSGYYLPPLFNPDNTKKGSGTEDDCVACPVGFFSVPSGANDITTCTACPSGYFGATPGLQQGFPNMGACSPRVGEGEVTTRACSKDKDCPTWSTCLVLTGLTNSTPCSACDAGLYSDIEGRTSASDCKNCPKGKYNSEKGAPSENLLTINSVSFPFCVPCEAGFYLDNVAATSIAACKSCPKGRFGARKGTEESDDCKMCGLGKYSETLSTQEEPVLEESCVLCTYGKFGPTYGASSRSECVDCPKGRYSTEKGMKISARCKACRRGFFTDAVAASSNEDCQSCPSGRYGVEVNVNVICSASASCEETFCRNCPRGELLFFFFIFFFEL